MCKGSCCSFRSAQETKVRQTLGRNYRGMAICLKSLGITRVPAGNVALRQHFPKIMHFPTALTELLVVDAGELSSLFRVEWGRGMSSLKSLVFDLFLVALATIAAAITRE